VVLAVTTPGIGHKGLTAFLVPAKTPGLSFGPPDDKMGIRGAPSAQMFLTDCAVPADTLLGPEGQGWKVAMYALDAGRIGIAAQALGIARAAFEFALQYAKERKQFGRTIGSFQAVKHLCAEMAAELEPARALVWYAAYAFDHAPDEAPLMAAHAKALTSEIGRFIARTSTEVHGGIGITDLLGLHFWFKRVGLNRQLLGGPEKVREIAARLQGLAA